MAERRTAAEDARVTAEYIERLLRLGEDKVPIWARTVLLAYVDTCSQERDGRYLDAVSREHQSAQKLNQFLHQLGAPIRLRAQLVGPRNEEMTVYGFVKR